MPNRKLSLEDKQTIQKMLGEEASIKTIADQLGVHRTTLYYEFKRCGCDRAHYEAPEEVYVEGLGDDIKQYIKEQGISQSQLSISTGITYGVLTRLLKDKRPLRDEEYKKICNALHVPEEQFKRKETESA